MIKFMAKIFFKYHSSSEPVQISDWTLFTIGDFVGSTFYIRPGITTTQLNINDFNVDFDNCFPGKFIRICNEYALLNAINGSSFFLTCEESFNPNTSAYMECNVTAINPPYLINQSRFIFQNRVATSWTTTYNEFRTYIDPSKEPTNYEYAWIFSDVPYMNDVFFSFDEIISYNNQQHPLNNSYTYTIWKGADNNYYGYYPCMYWESSAINPPIPFKNFASLIAPMVNNSPVQVPTDPYVDGGGSSSGGEGGGGAFDGSSDIIQPLSLNLPDVTDIVKIYHVADSLLGPLSQSICSQSYTNWQSYLPMFNNPLEALISLHWLPITLPTGTNTQNIVIGKYDTGVSTDLITNQFIEMDMGSVTVPEFWGNYLDYDATRIQLFLPYIGCINLAPDEVVKQTVKIKYNVDVLTGTCTAIVYTQGNTIIYSGSGSMLVQIPLSAVTYGNVVSTILTSGISLLSQGLMAYGSGGASLAGGATTIMANATALMSSKPSFSKTGFVGMTAGAMAYDKPYLLISRVKQCVPQNNNKYSGYPLYVTAKLSTLSGFTQVDNIHINNTQATEYEVNEIIKLLREGVIL